MHSESQETDNRRELGAGLALRKESTLSSPLVLTEDGLTLQGRILLLPLLADSAGGAYLPFDTLGGRMVALLSVALGKVIPADDMRLWQPINEALAKNDFGSAAIMCRWMRHGRASIV